MPKFGQPKHEANAAALSGTPRAPEARTPSAGSAHEVDRPAALDYVGNGESAVAKRFAEIQRSRAKTAVRAGRTRRTADELMAMELP